MSEETFQSLNGYYMYRGFNNLKCPHFAPPPPKDTETLLHA